MTLRERRDPWGGADDDTPAQAKTFVDRIFIYDRDAVERNFETFYAINSSS